MSAASVTAADYRLFIESITECAALLLDPDGHILTWNAGAERITGYTAQEIIGRPLSTFYGQNDLASGKAADELKTARDVGTMEVTDWRDGKNGTRIWAHVVLTALRGEGGGLRGFGLLLRDLTQRRTIENELLRAEQRFHQLVDAVADYSIFMLDPTGHVATWNAGARTTKGYEASEIIGQHFSVFYTPPDRAAGKPERILEIVRRQGRFAEEGWRVRKNGEQFWASVIVTTLRDEHGHDVGFAKITRDLTERRASEEQLRKSEERFRLLVEGVTDYAIYMISPEGRVETWNVGAERMKGYTGSEIIGRNFEVFFPADDIRAKKPTIELNVASVEGRFEDEGWRVRKDGSSFWANVVLTAIRNEQGKLLGFAKVTRDLTARRQAEDTERQLISEQSARHMAETLARESDEANRIKDEFLATVSHELRTPLNAIVGWASILRQRELDPTTSRAVEVIERNAHAQVKIIEDILDVSRIITGKLRIDPLPADLVAITRQAIEVTSHSARAKQISVEFKPTFLECPFVADAERIQQVVWNLLSNAIKFTRPGGAVRVTIEKLESSLSLSVTDTGAGIDPEFLPFLFERFRQADSTTTRRFGGLGLGLAIVRHIAELHGGSVSATSAGHDRGATFKVTLPLVPVMASASPATSQAPSSPVAAARAAALKGLRILVVEDDSDARELVTAILVEAGGEVRGVSSVAAAVEAVRSFHPQILISDIGMPDEDGYSLIRRIRELGSEASSIPSIAMTAYTRAEDRSKALAAGFNTFIGKPINPADVIATVVELSRVSPSGAHRS